MLPNNRFALKEWAVVAEALTTGRQLILLRKGGIADERGEFRLEHPEFFLYPTFEHQHRNLVRPEFLLDFDRAIAEQPQKDDVIICAYGVVSDCVVAKKVEELRRLAAYYVWNDDYLRVRFDYKPNQPLFVLLVRAYRTPARQIPFRPQYRGCKSWVEFDRELSTAGTRSALSAAEFESRRQEIRRLLGLDEGRTMPAPRMGAVGE